MKRSAMDIIIASSCAGKPMRAKGLNRLSRPSVSDMGEVVSVRSCVPVTSRIRRTAINSAFLMPCSVIVSGPQLHSTRPLPPRNRFSTNVNAMIIAMGFRPRTRKRSGIRDSHAHSSVNAAIARKPAKPCDRKMTTIYATTARIFVRGSSECTGDVPGKYCPIVMLFSTFLFPSSSVSEAPPQCAPR